MPSERLPAPNAVSCSTYETGSVTVLRTSGSRYAGGRPAPDRQPPRPPGTLASIDSIIHNLFAQVARALRACRALQAARRRHYVFAIDPTHEEQLDAQALSFGCRTRAGSSRKPRAWLYSRKPR